MPQGGKQHSTTIWYLINGTIRLPAEKLSHCSGMENASYRMHVIDIWHFEDKGSKAD